MAPPFLQRYDTTEFKEWGSANDMILLNLVGWGDKERGKKPGSEGLKAPPPHHVFCKRLRGLGLGGGGLGKRIEG